MSAAFHPAKEICSSDQARSFIEVMKKVHHAVKNGNLAELHDRIFGEEKCSFHFFEHHVEIRSENWRMTGYITKTVDRGTIYTYLLSSKFSDR